MWVMCNESAKKNEKKNTDNKKWLDLGTFTL